MNYLGSNNFHTRPYLRELVTFIEGNLRLCLGAKAAVPPCQKVLDLRVKCRLSMRHSDAVIDLDLDARYQRLSMCYEIWFLALLS
jgi:hypothetical protein